MVAKWCCGRKKLPSKQPCRTVIGGASVRSRAKAPARRGPNARDVRSLHRVGPGGCDHAVLLPGTAAGADRADELAVQHDRNAPLRGDRAGLVRKAHEA